MKNEAEIDTSGEQQQKRICSRKLINEGNKSKQKVILDGSPEVQEAMKVNKSGICAYSSSSTPRYIPNSIEYLSSSKYVHKRMFIKTALNTCQQ